MVKRSHFINEFWAERKYFLRTLAVPRTPLHLLTSAIDFKTWVLHHLHTSSSSFPQPEASSTKADFAAFLFVGDLDMSGK